ncbi:MAG TPA: alpha/beta fold hydrolase [Chloroflexota bacterium]|nr:alpha/beta fold hydrolase [Chloroflexota bacterium]
MKLIANGIVQNYRRIGNGPPVILIHALGLSLLQWEPQLQPLASAYTVIVYDVRGHGATDAPAGPYSMEDFADDLQGLMDALGVGSAHIVGLSMGGMIAQEFALRCPERVRSLVLANTTSEYRQEARRQFAERARVAEERGMAPLIDGTLDRWFTEEFRRLSPGLVERIRLILGATNPHGYAAACRAVAQIDTTERLVSVGVPTLVLAGDEDQSTTPEMALKIHEHIPGSTYQILPDTAHLSNVSAPDVFTQAVVETVIRGERAAGDATGGGASQ